MRPLFRLALPVAAAALLAGCGAGKSGSSLTTTKKVDSLAVVTAAQDASQKAGSAKMSMTMAMKAGSESFTLTGGGAFDYVKKLGQMTMTMPNPAGSGELSFDTVITDTALYLKIPGSNPAKPWSKVDLTKQLGGSLSSLTSNSDPSSALEMLRGAKSVTTVGKEQVRGTATTHYKAVIDINKAMAKQPAGVQAKLKSYEKLLGTQMTDLPIDVWIDDKGRPARFKMTMHIPASAQTGNEAVDMDMTIEMFDYGTPVTVTVPPASQVNDRSLGG